MSGQELAWNTPGVCPSCGVLTDHIWFRELAGTYTGVGNKPDKETVGGLQGWLLASRCLSPRCKGLAVWVKKAPTVNHAGTAEMVYPRARVRISPKEGLLPEEVQLYEEAAAVAPTSRRAASALLRVLLEAFLQRHLTTAGQSIKGKNLYKLIDMAVAHLDLSPTMKQGLTAIRKRGNESVHDPYGLTDDTRAEDLPWLFQAVDELVDDLHIKPAKWAGIANT